ncbi:MAG: CxxC-x17-CxxC domain-containing protein [Christensenellales bacterium]
MNSERGVVGAAARSEPSSRRMGTKTRSADAVRLLLKIKAREKCTRTRRLCCDCGQEFAFTAGEQNFCEKGFLMICSCRDAGLQRKMREKVAIARLRKCGAETEVPFIPKNDKPVYCSECFAQMRNQ